MKNLNVSSRDSYFENAKFFLILLVVIGHFIEPAAEDYWEASALYKLIYSFHMPMFILISGYFSATDSTLSLKKNFYKLLIPYFIFQSLVLLVNLKNIPNESIILLLLKPKHIMWYLFSLLSWRIILPFFIKLRYPIFLSILIALFSGYLNFINEYLSLSRTIVFFPFFLGGYYLNKNGFSNIKDFIPKYIAIFIFIFAFGISIYLRWIDNNWFFNKMPYSSMECNIWFIRFGAVFRLLFLASGFLVGFSFLSLVPRGELFITHFGRKTLYVYLLHYFLLKLFVYLNFYDYFENPFLLIITQILIGTFFTLFLSMQIITKLMSPLIDPLSFFNGYRNKGVFNEIS
jgi:fucose 4-O-acetylase-like acetyltransferase